MSQTPKSHRSGIAIGVGALLLIGVLGFAVVHVATHKSAADRSIARLPAAVKKKVWVTRFPKATDAPDFTLTDQRGHKVSLKQFRGKVVLLQFLDPRCNDVCPLISEEVLQAQKQLGPAAGQVAWVAVNVNEHHAAVSDVKAYTEAQGLNKLANFYFLTGSAAKLKAVWKAFGVSVTPSQDGDVVHSSVVYFIDPGGRERFLGHPGEDKGSIGDWATAYAFYLRQILVVR